MLDLLKSISRKAVYLNFYVKNIIFTDSWRRCVFILAIAAMILVARKTDSILNAQFWAEDGAIFFVQQYEYGFSTIFKPYAGYINLIPRLIALLTDLLFSYSKAPFIYMLASFSSILLVIANIFSPRLEFKNKILLSLAMVFIPHYANEIFMNIANIQWITCILLVLTSLKEDPNPKHGSINIQLASDFAIIILCGLTGPFIIFLIPLFIWRLTQSRSKYNYYIMFLVAFISLVQISVIFHETGELRNRTIILDLNIYSSLIGQKLFGGLFLGTSVAYKINPYLLAGAYFVLISILIRYSLQQRLILLFLYVHLIIFLAAIFKFKANPQILIPFGNGVRYFYIPYLMITWSLITLFEQKHKTKNTIIAISLCAIVFSSLSSGFHNKLINYNWHLYSESIGKTDIIIRINPAGWQLDIKARK